MEKKNLILAFLFCISGFLYGQVNKYVIPGQVWKGHTTGAFHPPFDFTMHMRHDSVLMAGQYYFPQVAVNEHGSFTRLRYLREKDGQVFKKQSTSSSEQLIYDLNIGVGDTLFKTTNVVKGYAIVDSLKTNWRGTGRKIWYMTFLCNLNYRRNYEIIEGIGSTELEFDDQICYLFETNSKVECVVNEQGFNSIGSCLYSNNLPIVNKQWVTSHPDPATNIPTYKRYTLVPIGIASENNFELKTTTARQGDNNWVSTGKIYHEDVQGLTEIIDGKSYKLFDYTLNAGDTFKLAFPNEPVTYMIVDSTSYMILLDQREYKRLVLSSPLAPGIKFVWVEGVGDIDRYVHYRQAVYGQVAPKYKLTCYYYNYNLYYRAPNVFNCDLKSSVESDQNDLPNSFDIYPNPVYDLLHISTNGQMNIEIFSMIGTKLMSTTIDQESDIDTSQFEKGMYIVCSRDTKGQLTKSKIFVKM